MTMQGWIVFGIITTIIALFAFELWIDRKIKNDSDDGNL